MHIVVVGLSHRTAPVEVREKLSIPDQSITESLKALKAFSDVLEVSILSTCNRLEIYALVKDKNTGISSIKEFISDYSGIIFEDLNPHLFCFRQEDAVLHLMKVSAGLDSLVLGEGQILSQVKKMMRLGQENQSTGPILNRLLSQSVSTGKKVRSETNLGTGAVSISSAAVELAQLKIGQEKGVDTLESLELEKVLVVGAGRMSRLLITHLKSKGCHKLILVNRNIDRALNLAVDFPDLEIVCKGLNELDEQISISSLVFTITASEEPIIDLARIENLNLISENNSSSNNPYCPITLGVSFLDQINVLEKLKKIEFKNVAYPIIFISFISRSSEIIGKKINVKIDEKKMLLNLNVNIISNFIDQEFPKIADKIEVNLLENEDNFTDDEWNNLYKLSEETFVEESDSLKEGAAGAGLTDND